VTDNMRAMARLTSDEVEQYRTRGFLVPSLRLDAGRMERLGRALELLLHLNPDVRPEKLISAHVVGTGLGAANDEGVRGVRDFLDLARSPEILDLVEQLIGPDIILWGAHVFCKPPGDGFETPWHQDGHYWPIRPLANCTVWVALEPSTRANGCLRVIPGSHLGRVLHPHLFEDRDDLTLNQRMAAGSFDASQAHDIELAPGQMSMHDVYMIHGALANRSTKRRTGIALRYMPGGSLFDRSLSPVAGRSGVPVSFATRPLWLLRGRDLTGANDFEIGHHPMDLATRR
jgi:hypothetical protein